MTSTFDIHKNFFPWGKLDSISIHLKSYTRSSDGRVGVWPGCVTYQEIEYGCNELIAELEEIKKQSKKLFEKKFEKKPTIEEESKS